jgi:excisionase family DNA binding protein
MVVAASTPALRPPREVRMISPSESEPFVTPQEAAEFLRCSPITVKRLARDGKIPAHSVTNGVRKRRRFLISELASTMKKIANPPPAMSLAKRRPLCP